MKNNTHFKFSSFSQRMQLMRVRQMGGLNESETCIQRVISLIAVWFRRLLTDTYLINPSFYSIASKNQQRVLGLIVARWQLNSMEVILVESVSELISPLRFYWLHWCRCCTSKRPRCKHSTRPLLCCCMHSETSLHQLHLYSCLKGERLNKQAATI